MSSSPRNRVRHAMLAVLALIAICAIGASTASAAEFEITEFGASLTDSGAPELQAGAHADVTTTVGFPTEIDPVTEKEVVLENAKNIIVDTPPGVIGNPTAVPACAPVDLAKQGVAACSENSQIGTATLKFGLGGTEMFEFPTPLYNIEPPHGVAARFGFNTLSVVTVLDAVVDSHGGYHIQVRSLQASQGLAFSRVKIKLWGVPASSAHDEERANCLFGGVCPSGLEDEAPFMSNPTSCSAAPAVFGLSVNSWQNPGRMLTSAIDHDTFGEPLRMTGCDQVPFAPRVAMEPTNHEAGAPTGLLVKMSLPQSNDPDGLAEADLRDAEVTLPAGMTISPASAAGLETCSDAQLDLGESTPATCPNASKLGAATLTSPVLEEPLTGAIYLRPQASGDPESGDMYRLAIELANPERGIDIKLPGSIRASRSDGRLVARFDENPQLPFTELTLNFSSGPRAALKNPSSCGPAIATANLSSWSGAQVSISNKFDIDSGCGGQAFAPSLEAGSANPVAGAGSPFTLRVTQGDGQPNLSSIETVLPTGLLAKLAGIPLCGASEAAAGACPASSQVGQATVGVGTGTQPIYVPQPGKTPTGVYLSGPYKGAPYSLVVKVPAQAGPFDLGTVAIRNALFVDPTTTQVTVKSDPLPQILGGIPLAYRDIRVEIDRPDFTLNPTNCEPKQVGSTLLAANGATAQPSSRFQVGECGALGLEPKLRLKFSGAPTRRGGHPKLTATLTTGKNESSLRRVQVTLPKTEYLENAHIRTVCTRVQYAANQCPETSIYGWARAWTPLLDKPLEGPVYLRSSNHKLPDLVASLDGQIHIDLAGRISSYKSRIRNTFETVPDAPVSKFVLTMQGGGKGLLVNNTDLCKAKPRANVEFNGQNGKLHDTEPLVSVAGCGKGGKKK